MAFLRTVLYLHAGIWALVGAGLALVPRLVVEDIFGQPPTPEYAFVRLAGVVMIGLAMQMVLVGHRAEELWWWSWGFALTTGAVAAVLTVNAAFGLDPGVPAAMWWVAAIVSWALASGTLLGMQRAGREKPLDRFEPAPARKPRPAR